MRGVILFACLWVGGCSLPHHLTTPERGFHLSGVQHSVGRYILEEVTP